jgi:hypothetical protein
MVDIDYLLGIKTEEEKNKELKEEEKNDPIAQQGIAGDTLMRPVRGINSHVSPFEAKIIDKKGKVGEELVVAMADGGSIAPDGRPMYSKLSSWVDETFYGGKKKNLERQAYSIADQGLMDLVTNSENQLENLSESADLEAETIQTASAQETEKLSEAGASQIAKSGFQGANPSSVAVEEMMSDVVETGQQKLEGITQEKSGAIENVIANVNKEKNAILGSYQAATGSAYNQGRQPYRDVTDFIDSFLAEDEDV